MDERLVQILPEPMKLDIDALNAAAERRGAEQRAEHDKLIASLATYRIPKPEQREFEFSDETIEEAIVSAVEWIEDLLDHREYECGFLKSEYHDGRTLWYSSPSWNKVSGLKTVAEILSTKTRNWRGHPANYVSWGEVLSELIDDELRDSSEHPHCDLLNGDQELSEIVYETLVVTSSDVWDEAVKRSQPYLDEILRKDAEADGEDEEEDAV